MTKIRIKYKGNTRTFYTRKDWKQGRKLYLYYYKEPRCTGNWYTDPNYQGYSWQDYEREYSRQQREGTTEVISKNVIEMKELVEKHNDEILSLAEKGLKFLNLEEFIKE